MPMMLTYILTFFIYFYSRKRLHTYKASALDCSPFFQLEQSGSYRFCFHLKSNNVIRSMEFNVTSDKWFVLNISSMFKVIV